MNAIEIGRRISETRKSRGLTLQDVASDIGVAKSTIYRYERGAIDNAKMPVLEAIARVLRVNPAWLIGKSEIMEPAPAASESNGREQEFNELFGQLSEDQQTLVVQAMKGFLSKQ